MPDSAVTERAIHEVAAAREASICAQSKPANDEAAQQTHQSNA
jgi:hypothetical protein